MPMHVQDVYKFVCIDKRARNKLNMPPINYLLPIFSIMLGFVGKCVSFVLRRIHNNVI